MPEAAAPLPASDTVAVHVVDELTTVGFATQLTVVVVGRVLGTSEKSTAVYDWFVTVMDCDCGATKPDAEAVSVSVGALFGYWMLNV